MTPSSGFCVRQRPDSLFLWERWTEMTLEELKKGEHVTVEYKLDIPQEREKYLKSAVAFANGAGGRLIFGVK
ncbi:MAG: ATP-binding protein, partial [Lachnospiraceae bacterium]|nr:ATP-binding protein [Lachnospiraceae bacterium]